MGMVKLTCKLLNGSELDINIDSNALVQDLWKVIEENGGPKANCQSLNLLREQKLPLRMVYDKILSDYDVKDGDVIVVCEIHRAFVSEETK